MSGEVQIVIGIDNARLHPRFVDEEGGMVLSRSVITNNLILGGNIDET